nr:hypothetical protein [uncultured Pseudomonas sp.]
MKRQATKATTAEIELHIERQRELGELMIGDVDKIRPIELAVTAIALALTFLDYKYGWWDALRAWIGGL